LKSPDSDEGIQGIPSKSGANPSDAEAVQWLMGDNPRNSKLLVWRRARDARLVGFAGSSVR
jgi:hypothetical protein